MRKKQHLNITTSTDESEPKKSRFKEYQTVIGSLEKYLGQMISVDPDKELKSIEIFPEEENGFILIPWRVEKFEFLCQLVNIANCLSWLTLLPIRLCLSFENFRENISISKKAKTDIYKFVLMLLSVATLIYFMPSSIIYHYIRAQSPLRIFVLDKLIEMSDFLMRNIGQDAIELMCKSIHRPKSRARFVCSFGMVYLYSIAHSLLLIIQQYTLSACLHSSGLLLTLLVSQNVVELKISIFKRNDVTSIYRLLGNDAVDRFQLFVYCTIILIDAQMDVDVIIASLILILNKVFMDWAKYLLIGKMSHLNYDLWDQCREIFYVEYIKSKIQYISVNWTEVLKNPSYSQIKGCCNSKNKQLMGVLLDSFMCVSKNLNFLTIPQLCIILRFAIPKLVIIFRYDYFITFVLLWLIALVFVVLFDIRLCGYSIRKVCLEIE